MELADRTLDKVKSNLVFLFLLSEKLSNSILPMEIKTEGQGFVK